VIHRHLNGAGRLLVALFVVAGAVQCRGSDDASGSGDVGGAGPVASGGTSAADAGAAGAGLGNSGGTSGVGTGGDSASQSGIAARYPCDVGIDNDPAFLFREDFEENSVDSLLARYSDHNGESSSMALISDAPNGSCGKASGRFTADPNATTSSLFRQISGIDDLYCRAYVKYQAGITWHHSGLSIKGYNPPSPWPLGLAGLKPNGDDSFSVALEPVFGVGSPNPRFDLYAYWMKMHSWMDQPQGDQAYYGNSLVHQNAFTADDDTWICVELHVKLNTDTSSSTGAALDLWKNDVLVQHFDEQTPLGCWIKDNFCPAGADGPECTDYPSLCAQPYVPADLQWRSTSALQVTGIGFGNYITEGVQGSVQFDDVVVAKARIGCIQH
jgi:hypothetical protein